MKLDDQVCDLGLAKRLKELGVKQESYFWWRVECGGRDPFVSNFNSGDNECGCVNYSAFTVAELGAILPESLGSSPDDHGHLHLGYGTRAVGKWTAGYANYDKRITEIFDDVKEADVRARLLIYLIEHKLYEVPK